jgi:peptidase C39-like protein
VWSDALLQAQHKDDQGRKLLTQAANVPVGPVAEGRALVLGDGMSDEQALAAASQALTLAAEGASDRLTAAQNLVVDALPEITEALTQATTLARAQHVVDVSPEFGILLATALSPDGTPIVSQTVASAGQQRFDALPAAGQTAFESLLASSTSPQEAAYVWKALAAGNSLKTVEGFDKAIRPYGNNQQWLADHLTPDLTGQPGQMLNQGKGYFATYKGQQDGNQDIQGWDIYDQGNIGDCAAASTVVARATVDPVYMLGLTTGYKAGAASIPQPVNDSPAAFHTRLQQAYTGALHKSQENPDALANQLLDPSSGDYSYQFATNAAQRQALFSEIGATAESGQPVFIDVDTQQAIAKAAVTGDYGGHQVVAVGYNPANNQLQIYNPWGFTQNVTEKQFVDGQLPINATGKPSGALPVPYGVEMPG